MFLPEGKFSGLSYIFGLSKSSSTSPNSELNKISETPGSDSFIKLGET